MATLAKKQCPGDWENMDIMDELILPLQEASNKIDARAARSSKLISLVDALIQFPYADSFAMYRVIKDTPLTLQHVPYCDAWQISAAHIRGLRRADVVTMLFADQELTRVLSKTKVGRCVAVKPPES